MRRIFIAIGLSFMALSIGLTETDLFARDISDTQAIIEGNNTFAFDLYTELSKEGGNIFLSPYSISTALAMVYAGARGDTETQMADTLHFNPSQQRLHPALSELRKAIESDSQSGYQLSIANALWGQTGYKFYDEFINITKNYYNAGFKEVDFIDAKNREETRQAINIWVENKTNDKIKGLIKQGILDDLTRLVLTNAIYFKGKWKFQFDAKDTQNSPFALTGGEKAQIPMMRQTKEFAYAENDMLQILEMPYSADKLSMVILLPKERAGLTQIENSLTQENLNNWLLALNNREVIVSIPRFKMASEFELNKALQSLGMADAFNTIKADFSGMAADPVGLYISKVLHKAFVDVNEEGTEAAAATAAVMTEKAVPGYKTVFKADRPFIFVIRETKSGSILFIGRLADPRS